MAVLFLLLLSLVGSASRRTITVPVVRGKDRISFDSARFAEKDVRRWIELSPNVSDTNNFMVPESLQLCVETRHEYSECGTRDWRAKNFILNANVNQQKIRDRIEELDKNSYPEELKGIVAYFREIQQSKLFFDGHLLQFFQDWQTANLSVPFHGIDPGKQCSAEIENIKAAPDKQTAYRRTNDWGNCVNHLLHQEVGNYPESLWQKFLDHNSIREELIEDDPGD